jgi:hypothetical protein
MKIKTLILFGSLSSGTYFAQQSVSLTVNGGVSAMYSLTDKLEEQGMGLTMKRKTTSAYGIDAQHSIRKGNFGVDYGIGIYQIGGNQQETFYTTDILSGQQNKYVTEIERKATFLSFPVLFTTNLKSFSIGFGGFLGIRLNNSMSITCLRNDELRSYTQYGNNLADFDAGLKFQAIQKHNKKCSFVFTYSHGFANIANQSEKGGKYYQFGISEITTRRLQTRLVTIGFRYSIFGTKS